jgi:hypothetical protein
MFDFGGGKHAPIVVIPTASGADDYPSDWSGLKMFKDFGATNIASSRFARQRSGGPRTPPASPGGRFLR